MAKNTEIFRTKEAQYIPIEYQELIYVGPSSPGETLTQADISIFNAGANGSVIKSIVFSEDIVLLNGVSFHIIYNDGQTEKVLFIKNENSTIDLSTINLVSLISSTTDNDGKVYLQIPANTSIILRIYLGSSLSNSYVYRGYIQGEDY